MKFFLLTICLLFVAEVSAQQHTQHEVYQEFEVVKNAEFPGGVQAFRKMVAESIVYPKEAKEKNIQGKSLISFVVDTDGSIIQLKVMKRLGAGCDEAAIDAILATKHIKWSPATNTEGKAVKVRKTLPVEFKLPKTEDKK